MPKNIDAVQKIETQILDKPGFQWTFETDITDGDHAKVTMKLHENATGKEWTWEELVARGEGPVQFSDPMDHIKMAGELEWKTSKGVEIIRFAGSVSYSQNFHIGFGGNGLVVAVWVQE